MGLAAAAVKPWSLYVLLAGQAVLLCAFLLIALVPSEMPKMAMIAGALTHTTVCFTYFYKRRGLFRAQWRWHWLERRSWLKGPDTINPDARPGFMGLTPARRRLFVAIVLVLCIVGSLLAGMTEK